MKKLLHTITISCFLISNLLVAAMAENLILDYIVAVVDDDVIVNSAFQEGLRNAEKQLRERKIEIPSRKRLEKQVLDQMILTRLQLQLAERTGIKVEDSQLNERLRKIAEKQKKDLSAFRKQLEQEGHDYQSVREQIRQSMIIHRLEQRQVVSRINISTREIDNFLATQAQQGTADTEYHIWHILIATPEAPSPEEIAAKQQQANKVLTRLKQGADFKAMAIEVSDDPLVLQTGGDLGWMTEGEMPSLLNGVMNNMAVEEIRGPLRNSSGFHLVKLVDKRGNEKSVITQTKVRHILIQTNELVSELEAQSRLAELKSRVEQGHHFDELARAHSDDKTTAGKGGLITISTAQGGLTEWVNPGDMVPEFEAVMNDLSANQVSEPFKSRYGWHIIQVLERRQYDNTEQALRMNAANQIHERKRKEELAAWWQQLRDEAYIEYRIEGLTDDKDLVVE